MQQLGAPNPAKEGEDSDSRELSFLQLEKLLSNEEFKLFERVYLLKSDSEPNQDFIPKLLRSFAQNVGVSTVDNPHKIIYSIYMNKPEEFGPEPADNDDENSQVQGESKQLKLYNKVDISNEDYYDIIEVSLILRSSISLGSKEALLQRFSLPAVTTWRRQSNCF